MLKYFFQLLKFRLSITVVFSAMAGYLLGFEFEHFNSTHFICLITGGFLVTGSANAFNQILEKDKDMFNTNLLLYQTRTWLKKGKGNKIKEIFD